MTGPSRTHREEPVLHESRPVKPSSRPSHCPHYLNYQNGINKRLCVEYNVSVEYGPRGRFTKREEKHLPWTPDLLTHRNSIPSPTHTHYTQTGVDETRIFLDLSEDFHPELSFFKKGECDRSVGGTVHSAPGRRLHEAEGRRPQTSYRPSEKRCDTPKDHVTTGPTTLRSLLPTRPLRVGP